MAEGVGFEPTGRLNTGQTISSPVSDSHEWNMLFAIL